MKAIIYCRVSTTQQETNDSLRNQIEQCKEYCEKKGYKIAAIFSDVESGTVDDRKEYLKLKEAIEENNFDVLVVYETSRISRKLIELLQFLNMLQSKGIDFISVTENAFDTTTPEGKFAMSIRLSMIQFERDNISKRVTERLYFKASGGQWVAGKPPIGYKLQDKILVLDEDTAPMIRDVFEMYLAGNSMYEISKKYNIPWGSKQIRRFLSNPVYAGYIRYGHRKNTSNKKPPITIQANHEPLVSPQDFEDVQRILKNNSHVSTKSIDNSIFNGLIKCGKCGFNYLIVPGHHEYFGCNSKRLRHTDKMIYKDLELCNNANIKADLLEKAIIDKIKETIMSLDYINDIEVGKRDLKAEMKELNNLKDQKERLLDAYLIGKLTKENFLKRDIKLNENILNLENEISKNNVTIDKASNKAKLLEYFEQLDFQEKEKAAKILRLIIDKVVVNKEKYTKKTDFSITIYLNII